MLLLFGVVVRFKRAAAAAAGGVSARNVFFWPYALDDAYPLLPSLPRGQASTTLPLARSRTSPWRSSTPATSRAPPSATPRRRSTCSVATWCVCVCVRACLGGGERGPVVCGAHTHPQTNNKQQTHLMRTTLTHNNNNNKLGLHRPAACRLCEQRQVYSQVRAYQRCQRGAGRRRARDQPGLRAAGQPEDREGQGEHGVKEGNRSLSVS